ncbi:hypothetical protein ACK8QS_22305 (plasmid) [Ectopseudomonas mendocina]
MPAIEPQNSNLGKKADARICRMSKVLLWIAKRLPVRRIFKTLPDGQQSEYLERYSIVRTRPLAIYLHHFVDRDQDTELHDHPWTAVSLVLTGGYTERYLATDMQTAERQVRWLNVIRPDRFHMISAAQPGTWTLVVRFKRQKGWGFLGDIENGQASFRPAGDMVASAEPSKHVI